MKKLTKQAVRTFLTLGLLLPVQLAAPADWQTGFVSSAWADDDDRDDDSDDDRDDNDDDDDRERGRGGSQRPSGGNPFESLFRRPAPTPSLPRTTRPTAPVTLPAQAPSELVVSDASDEDLEQLLSEGFVVADTETLVASDRVLTRLTTPAGLGLEEARDRVRALPSGGNADFNHFYRSELNETLELASAACSHENCAAWDMIRWPMAAQGSDTCAVRVPVGMIDTGINADHEIMAGARLELIQVADTGQNPSKAIHGTAVASLMIGDPESRVPGLIPGARVIAVDAFSRKGTDERADLVSLLRGLDALRERDVRVINLSLAGPRNSLLEEVIDQLATEAQIVMVAAAGNSGPSGAPAYPAAYDAVIAVTAVDARARVYRQAQRGSYIDLTAPGVNMLSATSIRGARLKSGTSFAVPFVTAAVALMLSRDDTLTPDQVRGYLSDSARDLGAPGVDEIFGHGLLNASTLC